MKDDTFFNLGVIAWYDDEELQNIIDFVSVGNKFIQASSTNRKKYFGTEFTSDDLVPKQFDI